MSGARGEAPGKVILLGEHSVGFGMPALAASLPFGVSVVAERAESGGVLLVSPESDDPRIPEALELLGRSAGVTHARLVATSALDPGGGLGSSGAFGIASFRALCALRGRPPSLEETVEAVQASEDVFHGRASGVDHVTSAVEGLLVYRKGPPRAWSPVRAARPLRLVVGLTGHERSTGHHVSALRTRVESDPDRWRPVVERLGVLASSGASFVASGELAALGHAMDEAHALLSSCGLSTPALEALVTSARGAGALGAKLTGAGGGGAAVALAEEPGPVATAIEALGFRAHVVTVGEGGAR